MTRMLKFTVFQGDGYLFLNSVFRTSLQTAWVFIVFSSTPSWQNDYRRYFLHYFPLLEFSHHTTPAAGEERDTLTSQPHSGDSEAGRGSESLQPDCTPSCKDLQLPVMLVTRHKIQENNLAFLMRVFLRTTWDVHLSAFWKVLEFSQTIRLRMCWR